MNKIYLTESSKFGCEPLKKSALGMIFPERMEMLGRIKNDGDRLMSLAASYLLAVACDDHGIPEEMRALTKNEDGKPTFKHPNGYRFSISHSSGYSACAISDSEIGCDIEAPRTSLQKIADRFFTDDEKGFVASFQQEERDAAALRIWTIKEAYVKATGSGFKNPPSSFTVPLSRDLLHIAPYNGFFLTELSLSDIHLAVCSASADEPTLITL